SLPPPRTGLRRRSRRSNAVIRRELAAEEAELDGEADEVGAAVEAELVAEAGAVGLHGLDAEREAVGNFTVRVAVGEQSQHLALARAQRRRRGALERRRRRR